jgi:N6-L-threonylcarbamoyladenine synthase
VVPEVASRKHIEVISIVVEQALEEAKITLKDIDAVAVTYGPGLVGALLVGVQYAKGLAYAIKKPLIGVNHIEGHISANFIEHKDLKPPFVCLVVSGGHTFIVFMKDYGEFEILGQTRDDAAGEAFDKVARAIGLGYPGGPKIDKISKEGNNQAIVFPRANFHEKDCLDFSFSGIKSAVLNYINKMNMKNEEINKADLAASFQKAVVDVLVDNALKACQIKKVNKIAIAGGVASNSILRETIINEGKKKGIEVLFPAPILCTDNAAMIGSAGYYEFLKGRKSSLELNAVPNLKLGER